MAPNDFARHWLLDPEILFLNHGSFGACPQPVLEVQQRLRLQLERQPVQFFVRELEPLLEGVAAEHGFIIDSVHFALMGRCWECGWAARMKAFGPE